MTEQRRRLGELVRAFETLRPTDEGRVQVASALGYGLMGARGSSQPIQGDDTPQSPPNAPSAHKRQLKRRQVTDSVSTQEPTPLLIEDVRVDALKPQTPQGDIRVLELPVHRPAPPIPGLLRKKWLRALLSGLVCRPTGRGSLDLDALLDSLIYRPPLRELPYRARLSTRLGVQILVDQSDSMIPYADDQTGFVDDILELLPTHLVEVVRFYKHPLADEVESTTTDFGPYRPPQAGTAVLLLSDLGLGPRYEPGRAIRDWRSFAEFLLRSRCTPTALLPISPARWPRELARHYRLVYWSRKTSVSDVQRAVRRSW